MEASTVAEVSQLVDVWYMTFAGLTVLAYDILLNFSDQFSTIWNPPKRNLWNFVFAFYRYNAVLGGAFFLSFMVPSLGGSDEWVLSHLLSISAYTVWSFRCSRTGMASVSLSALVETVGNAIVLNELVKLWECSRYLSRMMIAGFMLVHTSTLVVSVFSIMQLKGIFHILHVDHFHMCVSDVVPMAFKAIFVPSVVLQIYWSTLLLLNTLSRPRSSSQKLFDMLRVDGLLFFFSTFSLRILTLVITVASPRPIAVLSVVMPILLVNAVICRLYIWLNSADGLLLKSRISTFGREKYEWYGEQELELRRLSI
ncbi:uncharacterized protein FOMMEDRAFT_160349 [Fomitiporia mediterranea MF3/22]|uniref:uncharacterized protein n=1 Tax=Fomitiporia mediterranea (strain MF3/22) TaxID=694068 RepID=UPI0004409801|nr:uncharacterized protein FOMMEDRAFT_160349 [Fomitiporia mediterranea MF3/22]EJC99893.1 hypothetical protein FOMMEDRAFT_160349 [Fomitiporia mediterranea MF3/22]